MSCPPSHHLSSIRLPKQERHLEALLLISLTILSIFILLFSGHGLTRSSSHRGPDNTEQKRPARMSESVTVRGAGRGEPNIKLSDGHNLVTAYAGPEDLRVALQQNLAEPLSLASADFDEDGVPDLVTGYSYNGRGIISLLRGNADSIYPNALETQQRKANGTFTDTPFLSPAQVFEAPLAADFIGAGDFDADGHADIVVGQRMGNKLAWLAGDGRGRFQLAGQSDLRGALTALAVGELNRPDGLPEVVVGVATEDGGGEVLVLEGPNGAGQATAESFAVPAPVSGLALGALDGDAMPDVAVTAGRELKLIAGRDRKLSLRAEERATVQAAQVSERSFPTPLRDVAMGDFTGDGRLDVAALTNDGGLLILRQPAARKPAAWAKWETEGAPAGEGWPGVQRLVTARMTGLPVASIVGVGGRGRAARVLRREAKNGSAAFAANGRVRLNSTQWEVAELRAADGAAAVLPLRLNGDAVDDLVVLRASASAPLVLPSAAAAIFTVTSSADPGDGVCDAHCTLREAINAANASPGLDEVRFNIQTSTAPAEDVEQANLPATAILPETALPFPAGLELVSHGTLVAPFDFQTLLDNNQPDATAVDIVIGGLDPSFGGTGKVFRNLAGYGIDESEAVAVQPDGKVLIAGGSRPSFLQSGPSDGVVVRYDSNGRIDRFFGLNGVATIDFDPAFREIIFDVKLQADGKIVVFGQGGIGASGANTYIIVARLNSNGTFDGSFAAGGKLLYNPSSNLDAALGGAIQTDGRIVVCGVYTQSNSDGLVFRLMPNGGFDAGFGSGGVQTITFGSLTDVFEDVLVQPDGKIVAGGYASTGTGFDYAVARLLANGSLDNSFDFDGKVTTFFAANDDVISGLALQPDGKIVAAGTSLLTPPNNHDICLARYNPDGSLDTSFDGDGKAQTDFGGNDIAGGVALQPDGKIVISALGTLGSTNVYASGAL